MKIYIFVNTRTWRGINPIVLDMDNDSFATEDALEKYGRGWADAYRADIVMMEVA